MGKSAWIMRLALALAVLGASVTTSVAQTLTKPQFYERVIQEVGRANPGARVEMNSREELVVTAPGQAAKLQSLVRPYAIYHEQPSQLPEILRVLAASYQSTPVTAEALLVLVRPNASNPPPGPGGPADRGLVRPIAGDLIALVAVDAPDNYEFSRAAELRAALKMDDAAIWARALANTRAKIQVQPRPLQPGKPANVSLGNGLASSLLADDAFWNSKVMTAAGPVVVAAAGRDDLYIAALSDTRTVQALREELARVANAPETLSPRLLVRRAGRWEVLP